MLVKGYTAIRSLCDKCIADKENEGGVRNSWKHEKSYGGEAKGFPWKKREQESRAVGDIFKYKKEPCVCILVFKHIIAFDS